MENHVVGVIAMAIVISVMLLFLGIGVLVLIHVCMVGREISERDVNAAERGSSGSTSMSQDDIEKLPCFDFKAKEIKAGSSPPADCAVCLESFRAGERCRLLPCCNHSFHAECVDLWLLRAPICPICRGGAVSVINISGEQGNSDLEASNGGGGVVDSSERVIEVRERHEN